MKLTKWTSWIVSTYSRWCWLFKRLTPIDHCVISDLGWPGGFPTRGYLLTHHGKVGCIKAFG